jgi:hypothetical protein
MAFDILHLDHEQFKHWDEDNVYEIATYGKFYQNFMHNPLKYVKHQP